MDDAKIRELPPTKQGFVRNADVPAQVVTKIEGSDWQGEVHVKPLMVGRQMLMIEVHRKAGMKDPKHAHPDHESICYLVKGRVRVHIADEVFEAGPGDTWIHPAGVPHFHETLEDCIQLEVKSPPRKTWG
jgi:quercetin dioxygenase-like cupin family protein